MGIKLIEKKLEPFEIKTTHAEKAIEEIKHLSEIMDWLDKKKTALGEGDNSSVYGFERKDFESICVKQVKKNQQKIVINDLFSEAKLQQKALSAGVNTPLYLARVIERMQNPETLEKFSREFLIMQRVKGHSIGDILIEKGSLPDNFILEEFKSKLIDQINLLHQAGIVHRDLHEGNVMIDEMANPVIIDFGMSGNNYSNNPVTDYYVGTVTGYVNGRRIILSNNFYAGLKNTADPECIVNSDIKTDEDWVQELCDKLKRFIDKNLILKKNK